MKQSMKRTVKRIPRRASRHKKKQLPHILKHFTFIIVLASIAMLFLSSILQRSVLTFDAMVLIVFCALIDGIALVLQK